MERKEQIRIFGNCYHSFYILKSKLFFTTLFCCFVHVISIGQSKSLYAKQVLNEFQKRISDGESGEKFILTSFRPLDENTFASKEEYLKFLTELITFADKLEFDQVEFRYLVGRKLQTIGKKREAYGLLYAVQKDLEKAKGGHPKYAADFYSTIGHCYYYFGRLTDAEFCLLKALNLSELEKREQVNVNNTLGLISMNRGNLESAEEYYKTGLRLADDINDEPWYGVISGNLGTLYFERGDLVNARKYLEHDFKTSTRFKQYESASGALCILVRINLATNNLDEAITQVKTLDSLFLQNEQGAAFKLGYYECKVALQERLGQYSEAVKTLKLIQELKDQNVRDRNQSDLNKMEFQIDFERKQSEINVLQAQRKTDETRIISLSLVIGTILLAALIIILQISKRRKKERELFALKNELIQEELLRTETELNTVVATLMTKNNVVAELNEELEKLQVENDKTMEEQKVLTNKLQSFTLLTEEDWIEFKRLFEKRHAGFFAYFNERYPDVTNAEIRLAALLKLNLENSEMSKTLGISPDSVRKTNLRLRKKLGITEQKDLFALIQSI